MTTKNLLFVVISTLFFSTASQAQGRPGYIGTIADRVSLRLDEVLKSEEACIASQNNWEYKQETQGRFDLDQYNAELSKNFPNGDLFRAKIEMEYEAKGLSAPDTIKDVEIRFAEYEILYTLRFHSHNFTRTFGDQDTSLSFHHFGDQFSTSCIDSKSDSEGRKCIEKLRSAYADLVVNKIPQLNPQSDIAEMMLCQAKLFYGVANVLEFDAQYRSAMKELAKKRLPNG